MTSEFIYPLRIHIEDTDCTGLVYHPNYFNFMERARSEWLEQLGLGIAWQRAQAIYFLVHSASINYLQPLRVHEQVEIISRIAVLKRASIIFAQHLRSATTPDKIICKAEIKLVCVDDHMQPCAIPATAILETIGDPKREL